MHNLTKVRTLLVEGSITNGFTSPIAEILDTGPNVSPFCIGYRKLKYLNSYRKFNEFVEIRTSIKSIYSIKV